MLNKFITVQVSDTTVDAMKNFCRLIKILNSQFPIPNSKFP